MTGEPMLLKKEGGKKVTVQASGEDVAMIFWRKNDGVLLPLVLNRMEASRLALALANAVEDARRAAGKAAP